jgi:8-oxo-dGTP pyrophosphatase MutT (NUDIX family)
MERKNGPWSIIDTEKKYADEFLELNVDQVIKPDGKTGSYATVQLKSGVAILPMDKEGNVYLTRQFRYAIGKESIEVISGGIEEEGDPMEAAKREAEEEVGILGDEWIELGVFHLETSMIKGPVYLFVVKDLHFTKAHQDSTEDVKPFKKTFQEALQMVMNNEITHGPSCILILKTQMALQQDITKSKSI